MNDQPSARRRVFRFSILNLLVVTTIVALGITVVLLYRELVPLRQEVRRLRDEVGELSVDDPTKLHAIRVDTGNELEWKWRVWIPEGTTYRLRVHGGAVPAEGFTDSGGTIYLREGGEQVIRYLIRLDPKEGRWGGTLATRGGSVGKDYHEWVEWQSKSSTAGGVSTSTHTFDPGKTVELIRFRVSPSGSTATIQDPSPGFHIWLEPE